jgi:signal transduction histidine kinase
MRISVSRLRERGMTLVIVMVLLAVMCVFVLCAAQSVTFVKGELKFIEKRQLERLEKLGSASKRLTQ